jgi:TP53 regulating kinase-like protein
MNQKIISQGAEAIILQEENRIIKRRIKKSYRLPELDEKIRKLRTRSEAKLLEKASKLIPIPKVLKSDEKTKEIFLEFIEGKKLSENLDDFPLAKQKQILEQIGKNIAKLHDADIIHGDLTTSNMILVDEDKKGYTTDKPSKKRGDNPSQDFKIYFIDFGLGYISKKYEDKAVDLHLLKQALEARHFQHWQEIFNAFLKGYKKSQNEKIVLERLIAVEKRGRYRH